MALDRSYDGGVDKPGEAGSGRPAEVRPEQHLRQYGSDADAAPERAEPAEPRSRADYYEALRAADSRAVEASESQRAPADARTDRSGWDSAETQNRPLLDAIRITPERAVHILDGDSASGGGHRHGTGKSGKTEFPAGWNDEMIIDNVLDVARKPDKPPIHQNWNDSWLCCGTRANVEVSVVVLRSGEILTGWPEEGGPGVVRNPRRGTS